MMLALGAAGFLYLLNPTFGVFELIPDNTPLVGNLDEAAATALLIGAIAFFRRRRKAQAAEGGVEREVEGKVIDAETPVSQ